jgi:hypothetical protein
VNIEGALEHESSVEEKSIAILWSSTAPNLNKELVYVKGISTTKLLVIEQIDIQKLVE